MLHQEFNKMFVAVSLDILGMTITHMNIYNNRDISFNFFN